MVIVGCCMLCTRLLAKPEWHWGRTLPPARPGNRTTAACSSHLQTCSSRPAAPAAPVAACSCCGAAPSSEQWSDLLDVERYQTAPETSRIAGFWSRCLQRSNWISGCLLRASATVLECRDPPPPTRMQRAQRGAGDTSILRSIDSIAVCIGGVVDSSYQRNSPPPLRWWRWRDGRNCVDHG